jgi:acetyl esterase/lipase
VPEFPFPTGIYDCFSALQDVISRPSEFEINPKILTLGGVSAGGKIALIINHLARDAGIPISAVVVGTPQIIHTRGLKAAADAPFESYREFEFAPTLNWPRIVWFDSIIWSALSKDPAIRAEQEKDLLWFGNALDAPDLKGLAPLTVIMTAECDPLRDEGEAYAKKIEEAGNKVVLKRFKGVPHPFMHMDAALEPAREFISDTVKYIKDAQNEGSV